jgi:hypothetical protein
VDALDEARIKVNEAGYEAFVENIATIAQRASGTAFVLLGRTQTAETTWLLLAARGVSASLLSIQPFTRPQAEKYIELRIKYHDDEAAKRIYKHRQPFIQARDLIFNHLERAVSGGDKALTEGAVREFLGYAPALETVAVLLARETNYADFISDLSGHLNLPPASQSDRPLSVLHHVVTRLLDREQKEKLINNIRPALEGVAAECGWDSWDSLYSPEEQRVRLLGKILHRSFDAAPYMPDRLRTRYEEQLNAWFPEHPFLREGTEPANKVFESYLFATALREYLTDLGRGVEARVNTASYRPSRLLADFYILLGEQSGSHVVPARHIGLLYDSLIAGENESLRVRLSVESGDPDDNDEQETISEGEFELMYMAPNTDEGEQIEARSFMIRESNEAISFRRQLKYASIITKGAVCLGGEVDDFEVGPSVYVRCRRLEIHSTGFVVRTERQQNLDVESVFLEAKECMSDTSRKPLVRGTLRVLWPGAEAYPWSEYANALKKMNIEDEQVSYAYRRFRRIATTLQSHSQGGLARLRDKVEHNRILKGESGKILLGRLLADGIMELRGKFYHWCSERADQLLRISWEDLRQGNASPELDQYLENFLRQNPGLF